MKDWEIISEEASIVLVGNFNPKIFHPEWFIRKEIIEEWDYSRDELIELADISQITLPNERKLHVLLNKFSLQSSMASEHLALKDLVMSTFAILKETPVKQLGMNYTANIKINSRDSWVQFGRELVPTSHWENAAPYITELDDKQKEALGLLRLTMKLPRPDGLIGYIQPEISAVSLEGQTISFRINNHVEIDTSDAMLMIEVLKDHWESSLDLAKKIISSLMDSQLKDKK